MIKTYLNSNPFTEWIVDKVTPSQDSSWFCKKLSDKTASSNAALIKSFFNSPVLFASMVNKILLNSFKLAILSFASFSSYVSFKYSSYPISFMNLSNKSTRFSFSSL